MMKRLITAAMLVHAFAAADLNATAQHAVAPQLKVGRYDWPQWGGNSLRNNTPAGKDIPIAWDVKKGVNIKWKARLGTFTFGTPIVANGRVFVSTSHGAGYLKRFQDNSDLRNALGSALLCFDEQTGKFLWQYTSRKHPALAHPLQGWPDGLISGNPLVDGDRLWLVTNRFEVVCLDTKGLRDGKNDGPYKDEPNTNRDEADVLWKSDMMEKLNVSPRGYCSRSVATDGKRLFVITGNGVDRSHSHVPSPDAPSFLCLDRDTGQVLWSDNSPGKNILDGQWASPTYFKIGKQAQVLFPGGDGWLYSFDSRGDGKGKAKLLWKFDFNPKTSKWFFGRGTRSSIVSYAVVEENHVYIAVGQDPEYGAGAGHLYCIDPQKRLDGSDVSPTLAVDKAGKPLKLRRIQYVDKSKGEREIENPKSALIWHYTGQDRNGNGKFEWIETMHGSAGAPVDGTIKSVDLKKRTITVQTKTKTLELDVSRKAKISVKSKTAKLDSLKPGQKVKLSYHDGLEIVLKIEAQAKGIPAPELVVLRELNTSDHETSPWLSLDGLTIWWTVSTRKVGNRWVWTAKRKDSQSLFEGKKRLIVNAGVKVRRVAERKCGTVIRLKPAALSLRRLHTRLAHDPRQLQRVLEGPPWRQVVPIRSDDSESVCRWSERRRSRFRHWPASRFRTGSNRDVDHAKRSSIRRRSVTSSRVI